MHIWYISAYSFLHIYAYLVSSPYFKIYLHISANFCHIFAYLLHINAYFLQPPPRPPNPPPQQPGSEPGSESGFMCPTVCFCNQTGKQIPAYPGGHFPQASVPVFEMGYFKFSSQTQTQIRNQVPHEARCFEIGAASVFPH